MGFDFSVASSSGQFIFYRYTDDANFPANTSGYLTQGLEDHLIVNAFFNNSHMSYFSFNINSGTQEWEKSYPSNLSLIPGPMATSGINESSFSLIGCSSGSL